VRPRRQGLTGDARLLVAGQGVRAAGYGFTAVLLGALLADRGYGPLEVGVVLTALIAGTALASLAVGRFGDRFGRRRAYGVFFGGVAVAGVAVAAGAPLWVLLLIALTGTLSTDVVDNGPATTLEQAMLAEEDAGTASVYGRYNMVGAAAGALGALAVTLPGLGQGKSAGVSGWLFAVLMPVGLAGVVLAWRLSPAVEALPGAASAASPAGRRLAQSRPVVRKMAGLFWAAPRFPDSGFGAISCRTLPVQVLVVDFLRSPVAECRMETGPIIPELDIPRNVLPRFPYRRVRGTVNPLDFH
jgi:MFS family permease